MCVPVQRGEQEPNSMVNTDAKEDVPDHHTSRRGRNRPAWCKDMKKTGTLQKSPRQQAVHTPDTNPLSPTPGQRLYHHHSHTPSFLELRHGRFPRTRWPVCAMHTNAHLKGAQGLFFWLRFARFDMRKQHRGAPPTARFSCDTHRDQCVRKSACG